MCVVWSPIPGPAGMLMSLMHCPLCCVTQDPILQCSCRYLPTYHSRNTCRRCGRIVWQIAHLSPLQTHGSDCHRLALTCREEPEHSTSSQAVTCAFSNLSIVTLCLGCSHNFPIPFLLLISLTLRPNDFTSPTHPVGPCELRTSPSPFHRLTTLR